ncbi:MAG: DUF4212 domain-containing protein [Burkholderiaceae bacterium]|nr:MAG: DUF4212 domain-containing protein [Burkholderiaceae bacterium]
MEQAPAPQTKNRYWRRNMVLTASLLAFWFCATFITVYYARHLDFTFFGWPFSFWMAAQGLLLIYCLIVWFYARTMNTRDDERA